ncbi:HNH endonuclease [Bacillus wiedmannii]|uniref:HNH endonuclease n=1 Tax=Bacillus wiedmannii TaxID=1890302 RepID=UPI000BFDF3D8|nr:HNH endonuclease [Bacillus wiedmannii]PHF12392.1 HNH endonuclease [Bacillus wiedmannii]
MYNVIVQPTGDKTAQLNYQSTMLDGVDIDKIKSFMKQKDFEILSQVYKDGVIRVWGIDPSPQKIKQWNKIQRGDVALFSAKKQIFASATIIHKIHNLELAKHLWGETEDGGSWECIYFLDEIKNQSISLNTFNRLLNYKEGNIIQGFRMLDQEKSNIIMGAFDFHSARYTPTSTKEEIKQNIKDMISDLELSASLDSEIKGKARKEQGILRGYLFANKNTCRCGICGEEFPIDLLVAAHIKKRALCTIEEKLDIEHVAIPMCKFGCDELFERGYISVLDGKIVSLVETEQLLQSVNKYIANIEGKSCLNWNSNNAKYFEWHFNHHVMN